MAATQTKPSRSNTPPAKKTGLRAGFVDVTPTKAQKWLKKNKDNRPVRENQVDRYADLMNKGEWMTSPDAIAFDKDGQLINGQHRLKAIVQSGETAEDALVVWDLPSDAKKIADVGVKRTAADVLYIEGFTEVSVQELGAVMKLVVLWTQNRLEKCDEYEVVEKAKIVDAAELCTDRIYESIRLVGKHKDQLNNALPRSIAAFTHFIFYPTFKKRADDFVWEAYGKNAGQPHWIEIDGEVKTIHEWDDEGVDVSKYGEIKNADVDDHEDRYPSPAGLLRAKIQNPPLVPREKWLAWTIQAMNWYCKREPHSRLRYHASDSMPTAKVDMIPELQDQMELFD